MRTATEAKTKGHWPKGKRRNPDCGNWSRILLSLRSLIDQHKKNGSISYQVCAIALGVDNRTIARWRDGIDRPTPEMQELVAAWVRDRRKEVARI